MHRSLAALSALIHVSFVLAHYAGNEGLLDASWNATVFVGSNYSLSRCEGHYKDLLFKPYGSKSNLFSKNASECQVTPDRPGDYLIGFANYSKWLVRALPAALNAGWPQRFADEFHACSATDEDVSCSDGFHAIYIDYASAACTVSRQPGGGLLLQSRAAASNGSCSLETRNRGLDFFADPLSHRLSDMAVSVGSTLSFRMMATAVSGSRGTSASGAARMPEAGSSGSLPSMGVDVAAPGYADGLRSAGDGPDGGAGAGAGAGEASVWVIRQTGGPRQVLGSVQLPSACTSRSGGSSGASNGVMIDSITLVLDSETANLTLACGGTPGPSWSGMHTLQWETWGAAADGLGVRVGFSINDSTAGYLQQQADSLAPSGNTWRNASVGAWEASTLLPEFVSPAVLAPIPEGAPTRRRVLPSPRQAQLTTDLGMVDASEEPFWADPTGVQDSTLAINRAIAWAREQTLSVYLPPGKYRVSDTIQMVQRGRAEPHVRAFRSGLVSNVKGRPVPCVLRGAVDPAHPEQRAVIRLADAAPGFADLSKPKILVNMTFDVPATVKGPRRFQPNIHMNQVLQSVVVDLGRGNLGAVGVRCRGAQGTGLEDVEVRANDALVGISGMPGSGGANAGIKVTGGRWALDFRYTQPAPTLTYAITEGSQCGAMVAMPAQTMTIVGGNFSRGPESWGAQDGIPLVDFSCGVYARSARCSLPQLWPGEDSCSWSADNEPQRGGVSVVDTVMDSGGGAGAALNASRSIVMQNVWAKYASASGTEGPASPAVHASSIAQTGPRALEYQIEGSSEGQGSYLLIDSASVPVQSPALKWQPAGAKPTMLQLNSTIATASVSAGKVPPSFARGIRPSAAYSSTRTGPPADLATKHYWGSAPGGFLQPEAFPTWERGVVPARTYGVKADGVTDDTEALKRLIADQCPAKGIVQLPPGVILVSEQIDVGCALQGSGVHSTHIVPSKRFNGTALVRLTGSAGTDARPWPSMLYAMNVRLFHDVAANARGMVLAISEGSSVPDDASANTVWTRQLAGWTKTRDTEHPASNDSTCPFMHIIGSAAAEAQACDGYVPGAVDGYVPGAVASTVPSSPGGTAAVARLWTTHYEDSTSEAASYRHVLVDGVGPSEAVSFYHLNTEHAESDANFEVRRPEGAVDMYGVKSEGRYCVGWVSGPQAGANVTVWGHGGNACPFPGQYPAKVGRHTPSLYRVTLAPASSDHYRAREAAGRGRILFAGLAPMDSKGTLAVTRDDGRGCQAGWGTGLGGDVVCASPANWTALVVEQAAGTQSTPAQLQLRPLERPSTCRLDLDY